MEVVADHHRPGVEAADQDLPDEVLGRLLGASLVETDDQHVVHAGLPQELQLLLEVGQEAGRRLRTYDRGGVLVEGHHGGGQVLLGRHPPDPLDHQPVAEVDAVVGADRHRARPGGGAVAGVVEDLHSLSRLRSHGQVDSSQARANTTTGLHGVSGPWRWADVDGEQLTAGPADPPGAVPPDAQGGPLEDPAVRHLTQRDRPAPRRGPARAARPRAR